MVVRIQGMCRDPAVGVLGLKDGLVPESDDFKLGMVRKHGKTRETGERAPQLCPRASEVNRLAPRAILPKSSKTVVVVYGSSSTRTCGGNRYFMSAMFPQNKSSLFCEVNAPTLDEFLLHLVLPQSRAEPMTPTAYQASPPAPFLFFPPAPLAASAREAAPGLVCGGENDAGFGGPDQEHIAPTRHDRESHMIMVYV